jgi:hypothetical protein
MAATSSNNANLSATIRATLRPTAALWVSACGTAFDAGSGVAGHRNRWESWRIGFGGDKRLGAGKLALNGWYGGGAMATTNVSQTPSFSIFIRAGVPYVSQTEKATYSNLGGSLVYQTSAGVLRDIKLGIDGRSITANDPLNLFNTAGATGNLLAHAQHHFEGVFAQARWPRRPAAGSDAGAARRFLATANGSLNGLLSGLPGGAMPSPTSTMPASTRASAPS